MIGKFSISQSMSANTLTLTLTTSEGTTISADNPVYVEFPSSTESSGVKVIRKVTSPVSMTVSDGASLGHANAKLCHLFVYLIDNAGTVEMAVSNLPPDYPGTFAGIRLISTTAMSGSATSATGIYSTSARSNVSWIPAGMCKSTQTTAGKWVTSLSRIDIAPFGIPTNAFKAYRGSTQTVTTTTWTKMELNAEDFDVNSLFDPSTNYRYQPNIAGLYEFKGAAYTNPGVGDGVRLIASVTLNANPSTFLPGFYNNGGGADVAASAYATFLLNGTSDYIELYGYHENGSSASFSNGGTYTWLSGYRVSFNNYG